MPSKRSHMGGLGLGVDLAEINYALIYSPDASLYKRINLVQLMIADVRALMKGKKDVLQVDLDRVAGAMDRIAEARDKYDPCLEEDVHTMIGIRGEYDRMLDRIIMDLKAIIYDYDLLKFEFMRSFTASMFSEDNKDKEG